MKKRSISLLLVLAMMLSLLVSCGRRGEETESGDEEETDAVNPYDPREDYTVYDSRYLCGDAFYDYKSTTYDKPSSLPSGPAPTTRITFHPLSLGEGREGEGETERYNICFNPSCLHNNYNCPAYYYVICAMLLIKPEGRRLPYIYVVSRRGTKEYVDGEYVDLPEEYKNMLKVSVCDMETGETKHIADISADDCEDPIIYRNTLYFTTLQTLNSVDLSTGEEKTIKLRRGEVIGVYDDRIYFNSIDDVISSCERDLTDVRMVVDGCRVSDTFYSVALEDRPAVSDGILYFERNYHTANEIENTYKEGYGQSPAIIDVSDIYAIDLSNVEAGETLVAKDVYKMRAYNGDLYYTCRFVNDVLQKSFVKTHGAKASREGE